MATDLIQINLDVRSNIKQTTADLDKMGGSVINNINTINRLESEVKQLNRGLDRGRVSEKAYEKGMGQVNAQLLVFQQRAAKAAEVERKFGQNAALGGKSLNRFNMVLQQGGYQLQDFIVQLQSGTSVFTAFSQQGSQFASIFGPTGAVIGAVIAIGSAIGGSLVAAMGNASEKTKTLEDRLKDLNSALENYQDISSQIADSGTLTGEFGSLAGAIREVMTALQELQMISLKKQLSELGGIGRIVTETKKVRTGSILNIVPTFSEVEQLTPKQVKEAEKFLGPESDMFAENVAYAQQYLRLLQKIQEAETFEDQVEPAKQLSKFLRDHVESRGKELKNLNEIAAMQEVIQTIIKARAVEEKNNVHEMDEAVREFYANQVIQEDKLHKERIKTANKRYKVEKKAYDKSLTLAVEIYKDRLKKEQALLAKNSEKRYRAEKRVYDNSIKTAVEIYKGRLKSEEQFSKDYLAAHEKRYKIEKKRLDLQLDDAVGMYNRRMKAEEEATKKSYEERARIAKSQEMLNAASMMASPLFIDEDSINQAIKIYQQSLKDAEKEQKKLADSTDKLNDKIRELEDAADPFREYNRELKDLDKLLKAGKISQQAYNKAVDDLNEGLSDSIRIIDDVEDAFSNWISRGFKDFKSFVSDILNSFKNMLVEMAAIALRNSVLIPITTGFMAGMGSSAAAQTMSGMTAGTMGATIAGYGSAIGTGISNFGSAALHTITGGSMGSVAAGSTMASIGAVAPYILAAVAVIGLFTSKTKKLDEGLRVTVTNMDTLVESFEVLQKSRLFGLLKGKKFTEYEEVVDSPFVEAVAAIQDSILNAADTLGIGAEAFDNFSYQFELSLKGLTEQEKLQKVNEEILKMGDNFAALSGHFSNMNDLLATAQQRYDLETRLLQAQGNTSALLTRRREAERLATHDLNQGLLDQIYAIEDAKYAIEDAKIAFNALAASIQSSKDKATADFDKLMEHISTKISDAEALASQSQSILSMLQSASGRIGMTREAGLDYLRGLRGASRISDEKALGEALSAIGEPSEDLYSSFVDYQREFADQSNLIRELEETAGRQLSHDEQILEQLRAEAETAESQYESQLSHYESQLQDAQDQLNALLGLNDSVLSVEVALNSFANAVQSAMAQASASAQAAAQAAAIREAAENQSVLDKYGTGAQYKGFDKAEIRGAQELLDAANISGVQTAGKTGAQIQQDISNATGLAIGLDTGTRDDQFALGGYHSGGIRMVGERGPEIEATGPSRVFSANQTKRMMQNPDLVEAVKSMKQEISELRNEQRQLGINNNKYTKRTYDLYRQWDTEGLPAERT